MISQFCDPSLVVVHNAPMAGQDKIYVKTVDLFKASKIVFEGVFKIWPASNIRRDVIENVVARHQDFPFARPIIATGAAYGEHYGSSYFRSSPSEIVEFLDTVRASGLPAANFWSWDWVDAHGPDLWDAIADYNWPGADPPTEDIAEQFWAALTAGDLDSLTTLYHDNAVYITAGRAVQGSTAIRAEFGDLLNKLQDGRFHLEEIIVEENVRFLRWSADQLRNGLDTLGIRAGKIQYHSTSYQLLSE